MEHSLALRGWCSAGETRLHCQAVLIRHGQYLLESPGVLFASTSRTQPCLKWEQIVKCNAFPGPNPHRWS